MKRLDPELVVRIVERYPGRTTGQVTARLCWIRTDDTIRYILERLEAEGRVSAVVSGKRWRRWYPTWKTAGGHE